MNTITDVESTIDTRLLIGKFRYINQGLNIDEMHSEIVQKEMVEECNTSEDQLLLYMYLVAIGVHTCKVLLSIRTSSNDALLFGRKPRREQLIQIEDDERFPNEFIVYEVPSTTMPIFIAPPHMAIRR